MNNLPLINLFTIIHLILFATWGGIIMTETVIELYPLREKGLHKPAIQFHYWIDLFVELPVVIGVLGTGIVLLTLIETITILHIIKVSLALIAIAVNIYCIVLVRRRSNKLQDNADDDELSLSSRKIIQIAAIAIPIGLFAFGIGLYLATQRMATLMSG